MAVNKKSFTVLITIVVIVLTSLIIIKTFNLNDKKTTEVKEKENGKFPIISMLTELNDENRKIAIFLLEAFLAGGLAGFFIGNILGAKKKRQEIISTEIICPLCKEKFLKKTYKNEK